VWSRGNKKSFDDAASPDTTALMSYGEFSLNNDSYIFNSFSNDSDFAVAPDPMQERFPYWERPKKDNVEDDKPQNRSLHHSEGDKKKSKPRLSLSLERILHSARKNPSTPGTEGLSTAEEDIEDDLDSQCFSISTDRQHSAFDSVRIHVTTNDAKPECTEPSNVSVYTTPSSTMTTPDDKSRISLQQFMEERKHESTSMNGLPMNLGEISANDTASVNSSFLGVSFDEDYPQLVLQPSTDGSASKGNDGSTINSNGTLGATYPHPASGRSISSFDTTKKNTSCIRWLNESIDNVWKQIDQAKNDDDDDDDDDDEDETFKTFEDDGTFENEDDEETFQDDRTFDNDGSALTYPTISKASSDWVDDAVAWSFSGESGVKTITSMIEKDVLHPILKPICRFVEATEIPSTQMCRCGSKSQPPVNATAIDARASSYRMSPRISQNHPTKKM